MLGYKRASPQVIADENILHWDRVSMEGRSKDKYIPFSRMYVVDFVSCKLSSVTKHAYGQLRKILQSLM